MLATLGFVSARVTIFQKWKIGDGVDFMGKVVGGNYNEKKRKRTRNELKTLVQLQVEDSLKTWPMVSKKKRRSATQKALCSTLPPLLR